MAKHRQQIKMHVSIVLDIGEYEELRRVAMYDGVGHTTWARDRVREAVAARLHPRKRGSVEQEEP